MTEGFLPYFAQNKPEMLLTELEIRQFINHYKAQGSGTCAVMQKL
jgi:hypothetical protein